ncbi:SDR family NAD(P)-dependent oxidoreductase [Microbulbifer sp. ZKSA004]|uniref:SDR family NAD(P)-dependent oxidoreductase n=1 Tax=Microbulbifer sp. ZKSA004 TaxID=3243389 RepID=UPI00403915C7
MHGRPIALITGANRGIGLQVARDLSARGVSVLVGARDLKLGQKAADSIGESVWPIQLDVTDESSIRAAANTIRKDFGRLDILINNAAISHAGEAGVTLAEIGKKTQVSAVTLAELREIFETNVFGVVAVTQAMLPLLKLSPSAKVVNVSSGAGSLMSHSNPNNPARKMFGAYSMSKTALNAVTMAFSIDLEKSNIKVNAVCPGFTCTGLNNYEGEQTVAEGAREIVRVALLGREGDSGTFTSFNGSMPW